MSISRRAFMVRAAAVGAGFAGLHAAMGRGWALPRRVRAGYGPLVKDAAGLIDLPAGFTYTVFSRVGTEMADGLLVPGRHDGMAAFAGPDGLTLLVRNHENESEWTDGTPFGPRAERLSRVDPRRVYDRGFGRTPAPGGTTTVVYDTRTGGGTLVREFLSLAGTLRNCAGGPTPWGTWLSCEEDVHGATGPGGMYEKSHGFVFEVTPTVEPALAEARPLQAMGRFNHEAVAVDARSGVVFLTEDRGDGLIYRFIPAQRGRLAAGGRLQALAVRGKAALDTRNWKREIGGGGRTILPGDGFDAEWIDLRDIHAPDDDLRQRGAAAGAAVFARGEGMWTGSDGVYWVCTNGGGEQAGQVWRYRPSAAEGTTGEAAAPGRLELFIEPDDATILHNADNVTFAPWGDMIACEDNLKDNRLLGITPGGEVYTFARHVGGTSEFAGATFSPDGSTLFVNIQNPGSTLAVRGPWRT
ncbi:MAG: alkaline phosphatase PhoX [Phycisphaerales bacterium]